MEEIYSGETPVYINMRGVEHIEYGYLRNKVYRYHITFNAY